MGKGDGHGHQLGGFIAGIAEHQTLISCTGILFIGCTVIGMVDTHCNIGGLTVNGGQHVAGMTVETEFCTVIANIHNDLSCDSGDVHSCGRGDLAHAHYHTGGAGGFAGNSCHGSCSRMASRTASEI